MISQKSHSLKLFLWKNIFVVGAGFCAAFLGLNINTNEASALFVPTLSASVNQTDLQVNGNQVINSIDKTTEIPFNFTVNTNNRTGYTATLSAETENTALNNAESSTGSKINSIDTALSLNSFPVDAWGYKFDSGTNFLPIPALSAPVQIVQTTVKTNGNESNQLSIGMKLSQNLESGTYSNALVLSFISNPYTPKAIMVGGIDFQGRLARFDSNPNHVDNHPELPTYPNLVHIKRERSVSSVPTNAINLEADNSEAEIKAWYDSAAKTVYWYSSAEKVYLNPDCTNMFAYFTGMTDVDLSSFDTSEVENMNAMFYLNFALEKLDVTGFDTSRVKDMSAMFRSLTSLKELNITNFNTSKVETMQQMFYGMNKVKNLDISHFDTRKVKLMNGMFGYMYNLESLSLNNFDTSRVTDMSLMFASDGLIKTLDLSNFDTSNVVDMSAMFVGLTNLVNLNISSFNTSKVTNMAGMFMINPKIEQLDLSHFDTRNVTSMVSMFYDMPKLKSVNVRNFDTSKVEDMSHMFSHDDELTELDLSSFTTPKVKRFKGMFNSESPINKLTNIYVSHDWDTTAAKGPDVGAQDNIYIFRNRNNLVGGNGWRSSLPENVGLEALRIDRPGAPGYFTLKP